MFVNLAIICSPIWLKFIHPFGQKSFLKQSIIRLSSAIFPWWWMSIPRRLSVGASGRRLMPSIFHNVYNVNNYYLILISLSHKGKNENAHPKWKKQYPSVTVFIVLFALKRVRVMCECPAVPLFRGWDRRKNNKGTADSLLSLFVECPAKLSNFFEDFNKIVDFIEKHCV